uniref:Rab-GAP TBC domain-containing protein n=1 Tax=Haemonchus placei TaxID=6290 RepID=A0A0N4VVA3_HAEPC
LNDFPFKEFCRTLSEVVVSIMRQQLTVSEFPGIPPQLGIVFRTWILTFAAVCDGSLGDSTIVSAPHCCRQSSYRIPCSCVSETAHFYFV